MDGRIRQIPIRLSTGIPPAEGDILVIDTVGFNDKFWFDFVGHPHTEQLHTIERYTRNSLGTLSEVVTIDDPGAPFPHEQRSSGRQCWRRRAAKLAAAGSDSRELKALHGAKRTSAPAN